MAKLTEAQALREYLKIKAAQERANLEEFKFLLRRTDASTEVLQGFANLYGKMRKEAINA